MSTEDYQKGLRGEKPGGFKEVFNEKGFADQEHGYQDHLRNEDLAEEMKGTKQYDFSSDSTGYHVSQKWLQFEADKKRLSVKMKNKADNWALLVALIWLIVWIGTGIICILEGSSDIFWIGVVFIFIGLCAAGPGAFTENTIMKSYIRELKNGTRNDRYRGRRGVGG